MRKTSKSDSLYRLILKEYLLFTIILAVLFAFIMSAINRLVVVYDPSNDLNQFVQEFDGIQEDKYDSINVKKYLSSFGYFEVLDWDANVIYSSDPTYKNTYTMRSLYWIPSLDSKSYFFSDKIHRNGGKQETILYEYREKESDGYNYSELNNVMILDEDGEVLYATDPKMDPKKKELMMQEYENTIGQERSIDYDDDETKIEDLEPAFEAPQIADIEEAPNQGYLQKYYFVTSEGKPRYLIVHSFDDAYRDFSRRMDNARTVGAMSYVIAVIVVMMLFGQRLNRKVNRPLNILENAMNDFKDGKNVSVEYEGLEDLEEICDTFNNMSEQLVELDEKRVELEEERQKMLADISHDLKTPITVIQGYSKAMLDGIVKPEDEQRYLQAIYQRSSLMEELVKAFYEYSRLDHPQFHLEMKEDDFAEFLREYLAGKFEEIELVGFNLDLNIPETRVDYVYDCFQMKRVFENILSNAMKHNDRGTTIIAEMVDESDCVIVRLGDNGKGIPDEIKDNIFEPFVVGEDARTSGKGSGLGLSIVKKIIEAHNGTIELERDGIGTMYRIVLPKQQA